MGRWNNRRWVPRRRYDDERRPSPPNYYQTKVNPQGNYAFMILLGNNYDRLI